MIPLLYFAVPIHQMSLTGLVLAEKLNDERRRAIAGRLAAYAPFERIVFAEHKELGSGASRAFAEALEKLFGPTAASRPDYLVSSPWLAEAMPARAGQSRTRLRGFSCADPGDS